jgi:hypothetical protein
MAWPLFLNSGSKDQLHALVAAVNNACQQDGLRVEWKDAGATQSTFYDVAYARFEPAYNYRRGAQGWLAGTLRVYCQPPYGNTGTARVAATAAGTGPVLTLTLPTQLQGDAPALADFRVYVGSTLHRHHNGRLVGVAVLPNSQYTPEIPAASLVVPAGQAGAPAAATVIGASGAAASQALLVGGTSVSTYNPLLRFSLSPASAYVGRNRFFAIARTSADQVALRLTDGAGQPVGPTALATSHDDWSLVDLGVHQIDSADTLPATLNYTLNGGMLAFGRAGARGYPQSQPWHLGPVTAPDHAIQINELIVLPDDALRFVNDDPGRRLVAQDAFYGGGVVANTPLVGIPDELGNTYATAGTASSLVRNVFNTATLGVLGQAIAPNAGLCGARVGDDAQRDLYIRSYVVLPNIGGASAGVIFRKAANASLMISAEVRHPALAAGVVASAWLTLSAVGQAGATLLASQAISAAGGLARMLVEFWTKGPVVTLNVRCREPGATTLAPAGLPYASVGAVWPDALNAGYTELYGYQPTGFGVAAFEDLTVMSMPSQAIGARDAYELNGLTDEVYLATGGTPGGAAGVPVRSLAGAAHGRSPLLPGGTTARIAVLHAPMESGPVNEVLNLEVRVRERFRYAR